MAAIAAVAGFGMLMATGVDWGRWFANLSVGILIVAAFAVLRGGRAGGPVTPWLAVVAVAVALLGPYPGFEGPGF